MDGTLTVAIHDFDAIRNELGIEQGKRILEAIGEMPAEKAGLLFRRLDEIEMELTSQSKAQKGAFALLSILYKKGSNLGILTRNNKINAKKTLCHCGLSDFFDLNHILGRESVLPKPNPDGIHQLLRLWNANPEETVMVGDHPMDIEAGMSAGTFTIFINSKTDSLVHNTPDLSLKNIDELLMFFKEA